MLAETHTRGMPPATLANGIAALMLATTLTLLIASLIHFGLRIPLGFTTIHETGPGAAIPEALIAAVLAVGAASLILRVRSRWPIAVASSLFAVLGVCVGLRFTLMDGQTGDVAYHLGLLAALLVLVALLFSPEGRHSLRDD